MHLRPVPTIVLPGSHLLLQSSRAWPPQNSIGGLPARIPCTSSSHCHCTHTSPENSGQLANWELSCRTAIGFDAPAADCGEPGYCNQSEAQLRLPGRTSLLQSASCSRADAFGRAFKATLSSGKLQPRHVAPATSSHSQPARAGSVEPGSSRRGAPPTVPRQIHTAKLHSSIARHYPGIHPQQATTETIESQVQPERHQPRAPP